ncbi:HEAT repeat domain-containing protein [Myxococcota bacterium]|nr:HEAT repeat domain-containing protein [Myxococcota bacterium]MBU1410042.1 HEAT repeat domain-containing protein [Myxococcota bacterium]MBU1509939.1 HEAT repeat domain-containing protein [Myxococcota bacterium]
MNHCPYCRKSIDTLAGGVARVVDTRVVVYCSTACVDKARRGRPLFRALHLIAAAPARPARQLARGLSALRFPPEHAVLALSVVLFAVGAASLVRWRWTPVAAPVFLAFESQAPPSRWPGVDAEDVSANGGSDVVSRQPESVRLDPIEANGRALEVLEASLTVERPTLWDLDALAILAQHRHAKATARLLVLARTETGPARRKAAVALARIGRPEGLDVLREDLASQNSSNSALAAMELGRLGDRSALPVLKRLMNYSETRMAAAESALFLKYEPAKIMLLQTVRNSPRSGDRVRAAVALAAAGESQVRELLEQLYEDGQFRFMAAVGLGHLGDRRVLPVLRSALANTALRLESAQLLLEFSQQDAYRDVVRDMDSEHAPTRISAAVAVYLLTAPAGSEKPGSPGLSGSPGPEEGGAHG